MSKWFRQLSSTFKSGTGTFLTAIIQLARFGFSRAGFPRLLAIFIASLTCSFSIANHMFRLWGHSLPVQMTILIVLTMALGVLFFLIIHRMSGIQIKQAVFHLLAPILLLTSIFWLFYEKIPAPALPSTPNTILLTLDETNSNQEVNLLELRIAETIVPFSELEQIGDWTIQSKGDFPSVLLGHSPAKFRYRFTAQPYQDVKLLFLKSPIGGKATLHWHGQSQTIDLSNPSQDELLVTFSTTNNLMLISFIVIDILSVIILFYFVFFIQFRQLIDGLRQIINHRIICHLPSGYPLLVIGLMVMALIGIWHFWVTNSIFQDTTSSDISLPEFGKYRLISNTTKDRWIFEGLDRRMAANIQSSDVIISGSSLCLFALQSEEIHTYFEDNGVKYFNLCIPGNNVEAITEITSKFDIHPKALVLFYDYVSFDKFFGTAEPGELSNWKWANHQRNIELGVYFRHYFHRIFPYIPNFLYQREGVSFGGPSFPELIFRNRDNGQIIYFAPEQHKQVVIALNNYQDDDFFKSYNFVLARQLKSELDQQGIELAFTSIDSNDQCDINLGTASEWANILNVPMIFPDITDLPVSTDSLDGAHYQGEGAKIIGSAYAKSILSHLNMINDDDIHITSQPSRINDLSIRQLDGGWKSETIQTIESSGDYLLNKVDLNNLNDQNIETTWNSPERTDFQSEFLILELKDQTPVHRLSWITCSNTGNSEPSNSIWLDSFQVFTDDITWHETVSTSNFPVSDGKWAHAYLTPNPTHYLSIYYKNRIQTDSRYYINFSEVKVDRFHSNTPCTPGAANFEIQLTAPALPEIEIGRFVYHIRWSPEPILHEADWNQAHPFQSALPVPSPVGEHDSFIIEINDLPPDIQNVHFAIRLINNQNGIESEISNDYSVQNLSVCPDHE